MEPALAPSVTQASHCFSHVSCCPYHCMIPYLCADNPLSNIIYFLKKNDALICVLYFIRLERNVEPRLSSTVVLPLSGAKKDYYTNKNHQNEDGVILLF